MNTFAILFRQGPRTLTESELRDRTAATRIWAARQNAAGHRLDPRILGPEQERIELDTSGQPVVAGGRAEIVTAVLFLEAGDLAEAAAVARQHPALRYGASVEVRPWTPPPAPPPAER